MPGLSGLATETNFMPINTKVVEIEPFYIINRSERLRLHSLDRCISKYAFFKSSQEKGRCDEMVRQAEGKSFIEIGKGKQEV